MSIIAIFALPVLIAAPHQPNEPGSFTFRERTAALVTMPPKDHEIFNKARQLLNGPELVEYAIGRQPLFPNPAKPSAVYTYASKFIDISKPGWALFAPSGKLIAKGEVLPTAAQVLEALNKAGIQSPVKTLRDFLKKYPNSIEARAELMRLLRIKAVQQTRKKLDIEFKSLGELMNDGAIISYTTRGDNFPDISSFKSKQLDQQDDLAIWGHYAQELDKVFTDGTWPSFPNSMGDPVNYAPLDVCSQTMVAVYVRHLPKVEDMLMAYPADTQLWSLWLYMTQVTERQRGQFINRLSNIPPELRIDWPPTTIINSLVKNAQETNDWALVRSLLAPFWGQMKHDANLDSQLENNSVRINRQVNWDINYAPLLESMLRTASTPEAWEFVQAIVASIETRHMIDKCIELAIKCNRKDLAEEWGKMK
jgi:hypothetical protein